MNSITREQAEERLRLSSLSQPAFNVSMLALFPPSFIPKEDEVIAVKYSDSAWCYRKFVRMDENRYICALDDTEGAPSWPEARPLTDKERGQ